MDENFRFIRVLDELKTTGRIKSYSQIAEILGTNRAGISDIKSCRKGLSIDILKNMKESYRDVNLEWIISGRGEMIKLQEDDTHQMTSKNIDDLITTNRDQAATIKKLADIIHRLEEQLLLHEHGKE